MSTNTICLGGVSLNIGRHAAGEIPKELEKAGCRHPLLVTDGSILKLGLCRELLDVLEKAGIPWDIFSEVPSDPPSSVVAKGTEFCRSRGCDSVIGLGGGSVLDCAKAIKMMSTHPGSILDYVKGGPRFQNPGLPLFSVPTTSGTGSEVTQYAVITDEEKQVKTTIGDTRLVSHAVFLDPTLTQGLPPRITAATALDSVKADELSDNAKAIYNQMYGTLHADDVKNLYDAGAAAYDAKNYEEAVTNLVQVVAMDEKYDNGYAVYYLARSYEALQQNDEAIAMFQKFLDNYPGTSRAKYCTSAIARLGGQVQTQSTTQTQATTQNPAADTAAQDQAAQQ